MFCHVFDDFLPSMIAAEVADMLGDLESDMLKQIAKRVRHGLNLPDYMVTTVQDMAKLRAALTAELGQQWQPIIDKVQAGLIEAQQAGYDNAKATLPETVKGSPAPGLSSVPFARTAAYMAIASDTLRAFHTMPALILRQAEDAYKHIMRKPVTEVVAGTHTVRQATQKALRKFARQGLGGFQDRSGRMWRMGVYAEMAVRTGVHRAMRHGHGQAIQDAGLDLVIIHGHGYTCPLCAPWEGKILSLTGKTLPGVHLMRHAANPDAVIPVTVAATVDQAKESGLFHPNCGHGYAAYQPGVTPRAPAQENPETYKASQVQRRLEREIRVLKRELAVTKHMPEVRRLRAQVARKQKAIRQLQAQHPMLVRKLHRKHPNFDLPIKHHRLGQRIPTQPKTVTIPDKTVKHSDHAETRKAASFTRFRELAEKGQKVIPGIVTVPEGLNVEPHELMTARTLAAHGADVRFRPLIHGNNKRNPDTIMFGRIWEYKSPTGSGKDTIAKQFRKAKRQAERLVIELRRCGLDDSDAIDQIKRRFYGKRQFRQIIIIDHSGNLHFCDLDVV